MISELCSVFSLYGELNGLDLKIVSLRQSIKEYALIKADYIQRNEINERKLKRLLNLRHEFEYMEDTLLQENRRSNINAGKKRILLSNKIKEFQKMEEQRKLKLDNLPVFSQLQEIIDINEKLYFEYLHLHEQLENLKKDYCDVSKKVESDFLKKVVEFSQQFLQLKVPLALMY